MASFLGEKKYSLLIIIAAINWGTLGIFVRSLKAYGFTTIEISSLRYIFSAFAVLIIGAISEKKNLKVELKDIWKLAFLGVVSTMGTSILYLLCMQMTSAAVSNVLMYTAPIWIMLYSVIFFKRKLSRLSAMCIVLVFVGSILVSGVIGEENTGYSVWGIMIGLISGIVYGSYTIMGRIISKKYNSVTVMIYSCIFAGIGSLFFINVKNVAGAIAQKPSCIWSAVALSLICTVVPYGLYNIALSKISGFKAAVICTAEPITATVVSALVLKEKMSLIQFAGIVILICTIVLINTVPEKVKQKSSETAEQKELETQHTKA